MRMALGEITFDRAKHAIERRIRDQAVRWEWAFGADARRNRARLERLRDSCAGECVVVICNGPSLNRVDMNLVKEQKSICMNRSYIMFDSWGFVPTYFTSINHLVLDQFSEDIKGLEMVKFVDFTHRRKLPENDGFLYFRIPPSFRDSFQPDLTRPITSGGTVTYVSLQLAFYMGFAKVIIIGMDHRFSAVGTPNASEIRSAEKDDDHVHPDYFPKGIKWQLPDLYRSELAYREARTMFEKNGRRIIDATIDGACNVFEKMPLEKALSA
ncbi:hypothetical protein GCM10011614_33490 [Novosphingobium colocasiae]|uniref:6-hydroxymethylpterin diphosphokinase MptE-like domain-containing protein n=3 Tax=Bacteria TaxID=2 RepID=A0A918UK91_9SPHN|nr:hypothetical protein GCM10011614_33490 [Novosphingobium colocasiae]